MGYSRRLAVQLSTAAVVGVQSLALPSLLLATLTPALAQTAPPVVTNRNFPVGTQRGDVQLGNFPDATLNGNPIRFAPGGRIWDMSNFLVLPGSLGHASYRVNYTLDFQGMLNRVWILTDAEISADLASQINQMKQ